MLSPILGALADVDRPQEERCWRRSPAIGVAATAGLALVGRGDWVLALALFMLGNIGVYGSLTFYDSLLPHIAAPEELDRVSTAGYALGYLGGGLLLAHQPAWILKPAWFGLPDAGVGDAPRRSSAWRCGGRCSRFRCCGACPSRPWIRDGRGGGVDSPRAFVRLLADAARAAPLPHAFLMLVAFLLYNDGIGTIIRMASLYGTQIGIDRGQPDRRAADGAVHRRAVRVPLRRGGAAHRRQAGDPRRARASTR